MSAASGDEVVLVVERERPDGVIRLKRLLFGCDMYIGRVDGGLEGWRVEELDAGRGVKSPIDVNNFSWIFANYIT